MHDEIVIAGKRFVSAKRLAQNTSYTPDHLGRLCRLNKLECRLFGRVWFVNPESFEKYKRELSRGNGKNGNGKITNGTKGREQSSKTVPTTPSQNTLAAKPKHDVEPRLALKKEAASANPQQNKSTTHDSWDALFHHHPTDGKTASPRQDIPSRTPPKKDVTRPESPADTFSVLSSNRLSHPRPRVITPSSYRPLSFQRSEMKSTQTLGRTFPPKQIPEEHASVFSSKTFLKLKKYIPVGIIGAASVGIVVLLFFIGNALLAPGDTQQVISQQESVQETEIIYAKSGRGVLSYIQDGFFAARGWLNRLFAKKGTDTEKPITRVGSETFGLEEARERLLSEPERIPILPVSTSTGFIPEDVEITEVIAPEVAALEKTGVAVETAFTQPLSRADVVAVVNDILSSRFVVGDAVAEEVRVEGIVNRILSRSQFTLNNAATFSDLNALENKLRQEIFKVGESGTREVRIVERQVALTNKIDQLPGVTLIDATVSGTFDGLTDAHIPNDITASDYLPLSGGTLTGAVTFSGSSATTTFAGNVLTTFVATVPHSFGTWEIGAAGANPLTASFVIDPASADSDVNLFSISVGGSARFLVDAEGDVFSNSLTAVGGTTLSTTTASTFTVENTSTFGDATTTDRTYFNSRIGSSLIPTADNLLDIGDTTNALAWRTGIFGTSLGIGTSSPSKALSITDTVSDAQVAIAYDATRYAHLQVDSAGDLIVDAQGGDVRLNDENLFVCAGGACPSGTPAGQGNLIVETALGIASSSPYTTLDVAGSAAITGTIDVQSVSATSTFGHGISIGGTGSLRFPDGTFQGTAAAGGAADVQTFTSSGTWTKPPSGSVALIECWGGGGGGGGRTVGTDEAAGGGGGTYIRRFMLLTDLGATETVTIGAGGAGGSGTGSAGSAGGDTTFGAHLTAPGGNGGGSGTGGASGGSCPYGGSGGTSSDVNGKNTASCGGGGGVADGGSGGNGGNSVYGGGGGGAVGSGGGGSGGTSLYGGNGGASSVAGSQPGGGGGASNGTSGGDGQCRITVW